MTVEDENDLWVCIKSIGEITRKYVNYNELGRDRGHEAGKVEVQKIIEIA